MAAYTGNRKTYCALYISFNFKGVLQDYIKTCAHETVLYWCEEQKKGSNLIIQYKGKVQKTIYPHKCPHLNRT